METIGLYWTKQCWMSRSLTNLKVFGTMDIATAFTETADADYVLAEIKALNPDCNVVLVYK